MFRGKIREKASHLQLLIRNYPLIFFLLVLPPILLLVYIRVFGVSIVYWDSWDFIPLLERSLSGTLGIGDLFSQANEHRVIFYKLIFLLLAPLNHWNEIHFMYISLFLLIINCLLIFSLYSKKWTLTETALIFFLPVPWLLFNFRQWEGILQGLPLTIYLCVTGFLIAVICITKTKKVDYFLLLAILSGILSTFSFVNGLLVWPVCFILILLIKDDGKMHLAVWFISGIVVSCLYLLDWTKPSGTPGILYTIEKPFDGITYFISNIGFPLGYDTISSLVMGIIVLTGLVLILIFLVRNRTFKENGVWLSLLLFSLGTSLMITIGRGGYGIEQGLSPRYVPFTVIGIIALYFLILSIPSRLSGTLDRRSLFLGLFLGLIIFGVISGTMYGVIMGNWYKDQREDMSLHLLNYQNATDDQLKNLYPDPGIVRERAPFLEFYHLNVFYKDRAGNGSASDLQIRELAGWYEREDFSGIPARWMSPEAGISLYSQSDKEGNLSMQAYSFNRSRTLIVYGPGSPLVEKNVSSLTFVNITYPVSIRKGKNTVQFHVPEGCERPIDIPWLESNDTRCLSLAIGNVSLIS